MLSFYEFDCLLRKKNKQKINEMAFDQNSNNHLKNIAALLAKHMQNQKTASVNPPVQEPEPTATPTATPTTTPTAAPEPTAAPVFRKLNKLPSKGGVGGASTPTSTTNAAIKSQPTINQSIDPNDPDSEKNQERKSKYGREKTSVTRELKQLSTIDMWNVMMNSGGNTMGHDVSTWAWAMKQALQSLGMQLPPEVVGNPNDRNDPKHGTKFQIAFSSDQPVKNDNLPKIIVKPSLFNAAVKKAYELVGSPRDENKSKEPERMVDFDRAIKAGLYEPSKEEGGAPTKKFGMEPIVQQANMFSKVLFNDKFTNEVAGKIMTVKQMAHILNKYAPSKTDADIKRYQALTGIGADAVEKKVIDENDAENAESALMYMIKIDHKNKYGFFQIKSPELNSDAKILFVPPNEMRSGVDDLSIPVAASSGAGEQRTAKSLAAQYKAMMTRKNKGNDTNDLPKTESAGWMDVCECLEHWGF